MSNRAHRRLELVVLGLICAACTGPEAVDHCEEDSPLTQSSSTTLTYFGDIKPVVDARCVRCHSVGEIAPFPLTTYEELFERRDEVKNAVVDGEMPPWLPAHCCNSFLDDFSLAPEQVQRIADWVDAGAPQGDPSDPVSDPLEPVGGISRTDLVLTMSEPYRPEPAEGRRDDFRCFLLDWPLEVPVYVTGISPKPGARPIVHHLILALSEVDLEDWNELEAEDGRPGVPCEGGFAELGITAVLGGSLQGGDFPEGFGRRVDPGARIILNVHYSMEDAAPEMDLTSIELKLEAADQELRSLKTIPLANPAWLVGDAMRIPAGESNVPYRVQMDPRLITGGGRVELLGFTPHMHYLGSSIVATLIRTDGTRTCLTDIPHWDFGWEQPYWFEQPLVLEDGDELHLQCTFDNTFANQPVVNGQQVPPRDVAWGTDNQDMCAGFVVFSEEDE